MNKILMEQENGTGGGGGERDYVAEATEMGWVPKDKWTGDPKKWADAEAFVERGERVLPIALQENRELKAKLATAQATIAEIQRDVQDFRVMLEKSSKKEREELTAKYEAALAERAAAVTAGDGASFTKSDEEVKALEKEASEIERQEADRKNKTTTKPDHPDFASWKKNNPWYDYTTNPDQYIEANEVARATVYKAQAKGKTPPEGAALFAIVEKEMKRRYPELDEGSENRTRGGDVEHDTTPSNDSQRGGTRGKAKTYDNLPTEAKQACDRYIKNGMITDRQGKTLAEKRASYAANYDWGY